MITFLVLALLGLPLTALLETRRNAAAMLSGLRRARALDAVQNRAADDPLLPILMPVYGRPAYLRAVLDALAGVQGIERSLIVVSQDGRNPDVAALISGIRFAPVVVLKHERPFLGAFAYFWDSLHAVSSNIRFLLDFAFHGLGVEHAIVVEDDIVASPDFLRYFTWTCRNLLVDERVLSVTGFNIHSRPDALRGFDPVDHPHTLVENREDGRPKFTGWSWALSASMWRRVRPLWSRLSWDTRLDDVQRSLGLVSYKPVLARAKNIGMQGGINFTEPDGNPWWADVVLADRAYSPAEPPRLLSEDPATHEVKEEPRVKPVRNERERTRGRRVWLMGAVVVMAGVEILAAWWLRR